MNKLKLKNSHIGNTFYSYYLQPTSRGNRILKNIRVFSAKLVGFTQPYNTPSFQVEGNDENLLYLINQLHAQSANEIFKTEEEAKKAYDKDLLYYSKQVKSSEDRLKILSLMEYKKSKIDLAKEWYKNLSDECKEYIGILK